MTDVVPSLIDKQDSFEIVRDQIALILFTDQANQVALATTAGKPSPDEWKLRVFTERENPWELFLNTPAEGLSADISPIVNVWFESGTFDESKGDTVTRQAETAVFNVDVYGAGIAQDDGGAGHTPGDLAASRAAERGTRLVRNILMSSVNTYLQLRAKDDPTGPGVWQRWPQSISAFQPEQGAEASLKVLGMRLALRVTFNEFSPQGDESNTIDFVSVDIFRDSDGMLIAEADYDFT